MLGKLLVLFAIVQVIRTASVPDGDLNVARQRGLVSHNVYRSKHGAQGLQAVNEINDFAQAYAEYLARYNKFEHNTNRKYGENLYQTCSFPNAPNAQSAVEAATKAWYDEIKDYDFNAAVFSSATGHFTQVVWKGSKQVGFGVAIGDSPRAGRVWKCIWVVANYTPAGNYKDQFKANVLKGKV